MRTTLKKHGNSDALTFRSAWKEGLGIDTNTVLDVTVDYQHRKLIVEPVDEERKKYDIRELAAIAKNQVQPEFDEFDPVGDEEL
ncbi:AbrB/MazE/SpoVT family DNA-binding domain-containing protein [Lentibacillus salicampi]|uniref:AbrB/MazE/SpoVT family DNA-binding domain-containing protein n=1 Tax=Lentibacillus salicampi TaxID=175306 RepID=A0A4Y9AA07_9BACI|nr:hypothetical protein [Lentibacillus salicampi]TFJ91720.1 hypothetical protein E4U82_16135 [Lentibacillus salicampi]